MRFALQNGWGIALSISRSAPIGCGWRYTPPADTDVDAADVAQHMNIPWLSAECGS